MVLVVAWAIPTPPTTGYVLNVMGQARSLHTTSVRRVEAQVKFDDPGQSDTPYSHMSPMEEDTGDWEGPPPKRGDRFFLLILCLIFVIIIIALMVLSGGAHPG